MATDWVGGAPADRDVDDLHQRYARTRDPALRAELVERHQGLAHVIAQRACRHEHDVDDRRQVAMVGLLNAIDRFDPARGISFSTFAWATISGELKRFHRNSGWAVHMPRSLQELHLRTASAVEHLTSSLGRSPTLAEIAAMTGDTVDEVVEGLEVNLVRTATSLDAASSEGSPASPPAAVVGDSGLGSIENKVLVSAMLSLLPPRSREILRLRFVEDLSQSQIAARLGLSQMHISRLLAQALRVLRESNVADADHLN